MDVLTFLQNLGECSLAVLSFVAGWFLKTPPQLLQSLLAAARQEKQAGDGPGTLKALALCCLLLFGLTACSGLDQARVHTLTHDAYVTVEGLCKAAPAATESVRLVGAFVTDPQTSADLQAAARVLGDLQAVCRVIAPPAPVPGLS